jgi:glyoxylase-like metal-dependent hydrolase (beta-lactamase superfamily II)
MNTSPRAIHHLNCGTMCPRGARLITGEGALLGQARIVCHCLLIEGAEGLVLVDTGFGRGDVERPAQLGRLFSALVSPQLHASETAHAQLSARGFDPNDVTHIVTTHLDLDHTGGLPDFPRASVHVLGRELQAALRPGLRERTRYIPSHWFHEPRWVEHEAGGDQWFGFQGVRILPDSDDELLLIPLAGHTLGHSGVAVRAGGGWLLHCGDAYFHHGEVQTPSFCPPGLRAFQNLNQTDGRLRRENVERLRELVQRHGEEVTLFCSHDAETLEQMQGHGLYL